MSRFRGKYHVNPGNGKVGRCTATMQCKYGLSIDHFDTPEEARRNYEALMQTGIFRSVRRRYRMKQVALAIVAGGLLYQCGPRPFGTGITDGSWKPGSAVVQGSATPAEEVTFQGKGISLTSDEIGEAIAKLEKLPVEGESDTRYSRKEQYGNGFRNSVVADIEQRDMSPHGVKFSGKNGRAISGTYPDPYTGEEITVSKSSRNDTDVDHIVPLKEATESGAMKLTSKQRRDLANDPENLAIVSSSANRAKGAQDAGEYMPEHRQTRAAYARQVIEVKSKYKLSVDEDERGALLAALQDAEGRK